MAGSLQDQLLKAGLTDVKKAKKISKEKKKQGKLQRKGNIDVVDETRQQVQQSRKDKAERDRLLNEKRKAEAEKKAIAAQVKQLIEVNRVSRDGGDIEYNFTDDRKIKKIWVSTELQGQLSRGRLAIVSLRDKYEIVPAAVAAKIEQRMPERIILCNENVPVTVDEDDPYADYQIPDDLMW